MNGIDLILIALVVVLVYAAYRQAHINHRNNERHTIRRINRYL